jgi:hypothetical protein
MSQHKQTVVRSTYGLGEFLGDVGGFANALFIIGMFVVSFFSNARIYAMLTTALYKESTNQYDEILTNPKNFFVNRLSARKGNVMVGTLEEKQILTPKCIDLNTCVHKLLCCLKGDAYRSYETKTKYVKAEIEKDLDIVRYI